MNKIYRSMQTQHSLESELSRICSHFAAHELQGHVKQQHWE